MMWSREVYSVTCIGVTSYFSDTGLRPAPMAQSNRLGLATRFESRSGRIFVIVVVHIECSKLSNRRGVYSAAYGTVHYKEPLKSFEIRLGKSPIILSRTMLF